MSYFLTYAPGKKEKRPVPKPKDCIDQQKSNKNICR
jgi:hypothetical protein